MSDETEIFRREPPHDEAAEQTIIGAILERPSILPDVIVACDPNDFYSERNRVIYAAFLRLSSEAAPIDPVTLNDSIMRTKDAAHFVDARYVTELLADTANIIPAHAPALARLIHERAIERDLARDLAEISSRALDGENSAELLADAQRALDCLRERQARDRQSTADLLHETIAHLDDLAAEARSTGFRALDRELAGGVRRGELVILAAPTGHAKSTLALGIVANVAKAGGAAVLFSLEMTERELARRLLFGEAQVEHLAMLGDELQSSERERLLHTAHDFAAKHLAIEYRPKLTPSILRAVAQRFRREWGKLDLIVADYVQLMAPDTRQQNREREVASITRELKCIAGELDSAVLAVAQLNREIGKREDGRPRLSDLRDSGAIEQDADLVLFITGAEGSEGGPVQIVIAKNRRGPCSHATLTWRPDQTRFEDPS
jgi:replicative DNA helicase